MDELDVAAEEVVDAALERMAAGCITTPGTIVNGVVAVVEAIAPDGELHTITLGQSRMSQNAGVGMLVTALDMQRGLT